MREPGWITGTESGGGGLSGVAEAQIEASAGTVTGAAVTDPIPPTERP